jgi:hypothetical protein
MRIKVTPAVYPWRVISGKAAKVSAGSYRWDGSKGIISGESSLPSSWTHARSTWEYLRKRKTPWRLTAAFLMYKHN